MANKQVLLIVDDKQGNLRSAELAFTRSEYETLTALGGAEALAILRERPVDVVLTDLMMPDVDGLAVLRAALALEPQPAVVMITAFGTIQSAVEALKLGAFDYLNKPLNLDELRQQVARAMEHRRLVDRNQYLQQQVERRYGLESIIGEHESMQRLFGQVHTVAASRATVLLEGESGTGKELFARAIHFNSPRAKAPFIAFSCAALAESLLTSELFGHEKGAFTGAQARHIGRFERADGGTLFLDEIGEAPPATQVALLRVLETREFERVGGMTALKADVRLIAATNSKLEEKVRAGEFREDLFYRLQVVRLPLPPLRERASDIPLLVEHFLNEFAQEHHKPVPRVSREAMARLISEPWPGNVRELRNVIENTVIFLDGETIEENLLPPKASGHSVPNGAPQLPLGVKMADVEREHIRRSLLMHDGNVTRTAEALGLGRRTLQRKLKEMQLNKKEKVS